MNWTLKLTAILIFITATASEIVMRHDVDDSKYLELGKKYGKAVARLQGGCGTLIRPTWVITAGHLASSEKYKGYLDIGGDRYLVKRKIVHPKFKQSRRILNDIALLELTEPVKDIKPVKLYRKNDEVGMEIVFAGTGYASTGDKGMAKGAINKDRQLRGAKNTVEDIEGHYITFTFDSPDSGKALDLEGISGPGDSGGPALLTKGGETYILGVSSHQKFDDSLPQGMYGAKEFYARVSDYYDWIIEEIGE